MKTNQALTALLLFALMRGVTFGETAILFPQKDNTLYLDVNGQLSNGQGVYLYAGMTQADSLRRGLVAFDLTSIPANATITAVRTETALMIHLINESALRHTERSCHVAITGEGRRG